MADPSTRIFRASLRGRLYRDLELPGGGSLEDLAAAIVAAFGFDFDHAFGFYGSLGHRYHDAEERYELFADLGRADEGVRGVRRSSRASRLVRLYTRPGQRLGIRQTTLAIRDFAYQTPVPYDCTQTRRDWQAADTCAAPPRRNITIRTGSKGSHLNLRASQ